MLFIVLTHEIFFLYFMLLLDCLCFLVSPVSTESYKVGYNFNIPSHFIMYLYIFNIWMKSLTLLLTEASFFQGSSPSVSIKMYLRLQFMVFSVKCSMRFTIFFVIWVLGISQKIKYSILEIERILHFNFINGFRKWVLVQKFMNVRF